MSVPEFHNLQSEGGLFMLSILCANSDYSQWEENRLFIFTSSSEVFPRDNSILCQQILKP